MKVPIWNSLPPRKRKTTVWAVGLVGLYAIVGFWVLPPIVRSVAVKQISAQLDRDVSIASIKINPFALSTSINGLLIKDKDGGPFISWDRVYVNFEIISLFSRAWTFKEIDIEKPYGRAVMNKDGTLNFTDLIQKFSTNAAPAAPKPEKEAKPFVLHVGRLRISGAAATTQDLTRRTPFQRRLGPFDFALQNFRTDPDSENPCSFSGTTDAGGQISWHGNISLSPFRSAGKLTFFNFVINQYAPLYQDFVRFAIRDGAVSVKLDYEVDFNATNPVCRLTNSAVGLRDFKLAPVGTSNDVVELPFFGIAGVNADFQKRDATIGIVRAEGAKLFLCRNKDAVINVVELSKPAPAAPAFNEGEAMMFLLRSVTNAVAMLLDSTNQWRGTVREVSFTNCAVHLEDNVNSRPAKLDLTDIALTAKNISNLPGTNLDAEFSVRWNTNGKIKVATSAALLPPTADIQIDLDQLDLGTLDPYLEPKLNLFILGSKVGLHGLVKLRTPENQLPVVTFNGDASLDGFRTVDGVFGEDLVKWDAIRFNGIAANLNPPTVAIQQIDLDNVYAKLVVESNKTINLLNALRLTNTNAPATNETKVATAKPATTNAPLPDLSIGAIVITNSAVVFADHFIKPPVNMSIREVQGTIAGLSTRQLQHAGLALAAKVDGIGPVEISGTLNPFADRETNTLNVSVKDVDLTPASPYAGKFAGYRIVRGKLMVDLNYQIIGKKLESKNVITLDQFTFGQKVDSPEATHLPVRLAVAIMKDREGKIVLDIPVEGRLDDPQFRVSKVVWRAVENTLMKVATSPFSLLGAVFGGGGEELSYQDFTPGSAALSPAVTNKLDTLMKGLYERPGLNLEISGSVDPTTDRDGLQRLTLDKELRTRRWQSLGKAERTTMTPDKIVLTPRERVSLVKKMFGEAQAAGKITPELVAANTNLATALAQLNSRRASITKGAQLLMQTTTMKTAASTNTITTVAGLSQLPPPADPMEALLLATIPISDNDLQTLADNRARAVRDYLLQSGKVEAGRLFLNGSQTGGVRSDGSRVYLQFQ